MKQRRNKTIRKKRRQKGGFILSAFKYDQAAIEAAAEKAFKTLKEALDKRKTKV
jgi:hypothetical protein